jgi:hypothetical protein
MKNALLILTIIVLLALLAYQSLIAWDVRNVRKFAYANLRLHQTAAANACVPKTAILEAVADRGWNFEESPELVFGAPAEYKDVIRVFVEPPLNFAKLPGGVQFFFDRSGCYISKY